MKCKHEHFSWELVHKTNPGPEEGFFLCTDCGATREDGELDWVPCQYDPTPLLGKPIGMFHCPLCGNMVLAGQPHLDWGLVDDGPLLPETDHELEVDNRVE